MTSEIQKPESVGGMRFVRRRPRLTAGMSVPGLPSIKSVLFADENCEVYQLYNRGLDSLLLIGIRHAGSDDVPNCDQLCNWIASHGGENIDRLASASDVLEIVVNVRGAWMAEIPTLPYRESELYALLLALIEVGMDAGSAMLTAVPIRPLLWTDGPRHAPRLTSIYARSGTGDELEVIRHIGQTFLWAATGIVTAESESNPDADRLRSWCQNADPGLSEIIERCLGAPNPIVMIRELRREVGACVSRVAEKGLLNEETAKRYVAMSPQRFVWFKSP